MTQQQTEMKSILIIDDEIGIQSFLKRGLSHRFGMIETVCDLQSANEIIQRCHFDLIICDIRLPDGEGVAWMTKMRESGQQIPVIFITAYADLQMSISALRVGAFDFILKPFRLEQIQTSINRCLEHEQLRRENYVFRREIEQNYDISTMVGNCDKIKDLCQIIKHVAPMPSTVLIEGESGTGKELAARAVHELSDRSGNFVSINCGAMSAELLESELFGHIKGAFTGANQNRDGLFAYADKGTLFLDEIGEMPLPMQVHLLRVLEEGTIRPVGSNTEKKVNVRILAATNRVLSEQVKQGKFREDLYYRLNVLSLRMPPLRERKDDIALLSQYFIDKLAVELGIPQPPAINTTELGILCQYSWPGNVRELKNVIERSLLLGTMPSECLSNTHQSSTQPISQTGDDITLAAVEKQHILTILASEDYNKSSASRHLGISRKTLERKLKAWDLF